MGPLSWTNKHYGQNKHWKWCGHTYNRSAGVHPCFLRPGYLSSYKKFNYLKEGDKFDIVILFSYFELYLSVRACMYLSSCIIASHTLIFVKHLNLSVIHSFHLWFPHLWTSYTFFVYDLCRSLRVLPWFFFTDRQSVGLTITSFVKCWTSYHFLFDCTLFQWIFHIL